MNKGIYEHHEILSKNSTKKESVQIVTKIILTVFLFPPIFFVQKPIMYYITLILSRLRYCIGRIHFGISPPFSSY